MKKYFSTFTKDVKVNGVDYKNALIVAGIQFSSGEAPFGTFEYKSHYSDNIMGKMFTFKIIGETVYDEQFFEIDIPIQEPSQLDRIEANVDYLMMLSEVQ